MAPYLGSDRTIQLDNGVLPLPSFKKVFPHFYEHPTDIECSLDPMTVNATTGFLPTRLPIRNLPVAFAPLQKIVEEMPVLKLDGTAGLLATYKLGPLIDSGEAIADLSDAIDEMKVPGTKDLDLHIVSALFRDYSFLASSYLLEPCWKTWNDGGWLRAQVGDEKGATQDGCPEQIQGSSEYGLGRTILPACIARPLVKLAGILQIPSFLSYTAYASYNYSLVDETRGHSDYSNLRLIRAFEKGLDPQSSEAGFILTHIHMNALTPKLLSGVVEVLEGIGAASKANSDTEHTTQVERSLEVVLNAMESIEANMERMWANSRPKDYPTYRVS